MVIIKCYFVSAFIREEGKNLNINRTYSVQGRILKDTELEEWVKYTDKPMDRAILHSLLAGIYADYAARNQWSHGYPQKL